VYLTDHHRILIRETFQEIEEAPPPANPGKYGCGLSLVGVVVLVGFAVLGPMLGIGFGLATPVLILGGAALVVGLVLALTNRGFERGAAGAATEAALRELEDGEDDEDVLLRAATLLLAHAFVAHGPTMTSTFEPGEAVARIGTRMPLVVAVEEYLTASESLYPVFTSDAEAGEGDRLDPGEEL
jgi:hypothetical protein